MEQKAVSFQRLLKVMWLHKCKVYALELDGWEIPVLHGLILLAAEHPGMKALGEPTRQVISQVRAWCLEVFKEWGFSPEEVEFLDKGKWTPGEEGGNGHN